jgi:hypothetical protein
MSGLDYLDLASMSWTDHDSRKSNRIPFTQVRERLRECKLSEGWPRRYDRNGQRVFAFDSGWRCLGASGPYTNSLFLEINGDKVIGGRFIKNSGRDKPVAVAVPRVSRSN